MLKHSPQGACVMRRSAVLFLVNLGALYAQDPSAAQVLERSKKHFEGYKAQYRAHIQAGKSPEAFHPDTTTPMAEIETDLKANPKGERLEALLVSKLFFGRIGGLKREELMAVAMRVRQEVPGRSRAWSLEPGLFGEVATQAMEEDALLAQPDPRVKVLVLQNRGQAALRSHDAEGAAAILKRMSTEFASDPATKVYKEAYEEARLTFPGQQAPAFKIASLEDPKQLFTPQAFQGKYLLIDFWATWCGPCRGEMPHLHQAWERYKGAKFEILSLSFDRAKGDIAPFRQKPGSPMPWKHAFVDGGFESPLAKAYAVHGIPRPILIGPDGKILAAGDELRGDDLLATLEKHLGKAVPKAD
jgi:thiol-disulfide isomerase/thioredoxin